MEISYQFYSGTVEDLSSACPVFFMNAPSETIMSNWLIVQATQLNEGVVMLNLCTFLRKLFVLISILPIIFIIPGCGGGGGGDGGGGDTPTPPPTSPVLNYSIGSPTIAGLSLINGRVPATGMQFNVTEMHLAGSYNTDTYDTTLLQNQGMVFTINQHPANLPGSGPMTISLLTPAGSTALWKSGQNPTAGQYQVNVSGDPRTIMVIVNNTLPGGGTGVDIFVNGTVQSHLKWDVFTDLGSLTADYDIIASLAYNVLQAVYRSVSQLYTIIDIVMSNQSMIVSSGGVIASETALAGHSPAQLQILWNGSGDIKPGDSFQCDFTNWWIDNPGTSTDYFYYGRVYWLDFWEGTNSSGNFLGGNFKFGGTDPEVFHEQEIDGGAPLESSTIMYQNCGVLFVLSW